MGFIPLFIRSSPVNLAQKVPNIHKTDSMAEFLRTAKGTPTKPRTAKIHQNFPELRAIGVIFYISAAMGWILILVFFSNVRKNIWNTFCMELVFITFQEKVLEAKKRRF